MDKAGSPLKKTPSKKKRKRPSSDLSLCIICQTSKNIELMCATAEGKESLWNAACIRKDVVYQRIVSEFNTTFLEAKREIFYHKNCIAPYRSQTNLSHKLGEQVAEKVGKTKIKNGVENEIDWKICIICQKQKNKSFKKTHKLVKHSKCQKLLDAARIAGDQNTFKHFTADDLVNKKPVYHVACMQSIIHRSENKENKKTACVDTNHDKAFQLLEKEISEDLINRLRIFSAAELLTLYKSYLPIEQRDSYTTWKLKP